MSVLLFRGDSVLVVSLSTNDIVYNAADEKIYASVPGSTIGLGNTLTAVDPRTGAIGSSVFVGSEPSKLALANDGRTLYVSLKGSYSVGKFDTQTQTLLSRFDVGYEPQNGPFYAEGMAVSPDDPNTVALLSYQLGSARSLMVFNNGVRLPNVVNWQTALAYSGNGSTLFGSSGGNMSTISVNSGGAAVTGTTSYFFGLAEIKYDNGVVVASSGQIIDAATRTLLGTFPTSSSNAFVPDTANGRSYYILPDPQNGNNKIVKAFSHATFTSLGTMVIPNVSGQVTSLVKWGTNGLSGPRTGSW